MKAKVLFVIDSLNCGGSEKSLISLLPLLDYNKIDADLMIISRGGIFEKYIPNNVNIISLPNISRTKKILSYICQLTFSFLLRIYPIIGKKNHNAEIQWNTMGSTFAPLNKRYDVAIAYAQGFPTYYVATKVNAKRKYAWINADLLEIGYSEKFNHQYYNQMDMVITVSDKLNYIIKESKFTNPNKLITIFDIINTELIQEMSLQQIPSKKTDSSLSITTVGRMEMPKNYSLAVETAKILKEKGLRFHWYFVGDGSERIHIENLIKKYHLDNEIILTGMQPNPYPYMAGCDIYVQTSSFEGFCLTTCEARILNKPVVSTNFPVIYDQIKDGENGLIAEMTPESVADKILRLANDTTLRDKIIKATRLEINQTSITESQKVNNLILNGIKPI